MNKLFMEIFKKSIQYIGVIFGCLFSSKYIKFLCPVIGFVFHISIVSGQQITCSPNDKDLVTDKIETIQHLQKENIGETMVAVGETFLGTPYVAKTLEIKPTETLVVNLKGLDCTTFVENVLAFSLLLEHEKNMFKDFIEKLETIRYKNGVLDGYASRLHYFSEWIANNESKGLVEDVTASIGGKEVVKPINFMSMHRELYPLLKDDNNFEKIQASEAYLNGQPLCILAQEDIAKNEHLIQSGDIIALTTSIKGLDIAHTGIATREKDGRIHLLHASTVGEVVISKLPLTDYLKKVKNNTGIMVARVQSP